MQMGEYAMTHHDAKVFWELVDFLETDVFDQ
jgi:hypothetical protein